MKKISLNKTLCAFIVLFATACNSPTTSTEESAPEEAFVLLQTNGLTCDVQETILALDATEKVEFGALVSDNISQDVLETIVDSRETDCVNSYTEAQPENLDGVGQATWAITDTYSVEFIEETSGSGGSYPSSIYRDSSSYGWMCNNGSSENPADYIAQYNVSGAYSNRSSLRIRGTNSFASCYISDPTASRVYSDDDIRACFGYWTVYFCTLGTGPMTYESVIWR